jgi:hypothetical protein
MRVERQIVFHCRRGNLADPPVTFSGRLNFPPLILLKCEPTREAVSPIVNVEFSPIPTRVAVFRIPNVIPETSVGGHEKFLHLDVRIFIEAHRNRHGTT